MKSIRFIAVLIFAGLITYSCGSGTKGDKETKTEEPITETGAYNFDKFLEDVQQIQPGLTTISAVHEYFVIAKVDYFQEFCNDPENRSKYLESYPLAAANLGMYLADLMYHTYARAEENSAKTITAIIELSDFLGIEKEMYENLVLRYEDKVVPVDSTILYWNNLMKDSEKYASQQEKIFVNSALILGSNIEKLHLLSSLVQTPFSREITDEEATLAKKELAYFLMDLEPRLTGLIDIFKAQEEIPEAINVVNALEELNEAAKTVSEKGPEILKLDLAGIMANPELDALHNKTSEIRAALIKSE